MHFFNHLFRFRRVHLPSNHDLSWLARAKIERNQHLRHRTCKMGKCWRKCIDCFLCSILQLFIIAELRQPQKIQRRDRARGRLGAVVVIFHPEKHAFIFAAGAEIPAVFLVKEQAILRLLQLRRKFQPFDIEGCFVKIEKSLDDECVIVSKTFDIAAPVAIAAKQHFT